MLKKITVILAAFLLIPALLLAGSYTPTGYYKPAVNELGYGDAVNLNFDQADELAAGWVKTNWTFGYASSTTYTISGDKTTLYYPGQRLKILLGGTTVYSSVKTATYSSPNTTVTTTDAVLTNALTDVRHAVIHAANIPDETKGVRNRLINGSFWVDQRNAGTALSLIAAAAPVYTVDRWYAAATGANITGQQVAGAVLPVAYKFTGATGNTGTLFGQRIESANTYDLVNKNVTVSLRVASSSITTLTWTAYYANSVDNFSAKTQIATGTLAISSAMSAYSFTFNAAANAAKGICIEFTTGALTAAQTLQYEAIQLELGVVATNFEWRPLSVLIYLCERYFRKSYLIEVKPGTVTNIASLGTYFQIGGNCDLFLIFPQKMRATPTIVAYNLATGAANSVITYTSGWSASYRTPNYQNVSAAGATIDIITSDTFISMHYTADAEL